MRILHLVAYSLWSGPMPAVAGLAKAQRRLGHDVSLWYDTKRGIMQGYEEEARKADASSINRSRDCRP